MSDFELELNVPGHFLNQNWSATNLRKLHEHIDELGEMEVESIRSRTEEITGALKEAEEYLPSYDPEDPNLLILDAAPGPQLDEWKRIYVAYQEGGALGLPTFTNPPRLMFAQVETVDIPQIEAWAAMAIQDSLDVLAAGEGDEL